MPYLISGFHSFCKICKMSTEASIKFDGDKAFYKVHVPKHGRIFCIPKLISLTFNRSKCWSYNALRENIGSSIQTLNPKLVDVFRS